MSAQWPASTGGLLWRADLIFCGEAEGSSSVSDPEGCSLSPSWDPVSPTSSRRNLNLDKNRCHTKYQPHTISNRTISSVATNTSRVSPTLCHILRAGGWARAQRRAAERRGGGEPVRLERDICRAIELLEKLQRSGEVPPQKLQALQRVLQSEFCNAVREVYEHVYETVDISSSPEVRANATAKATVAAFAASEGHSHPRVVELPKTEEGLGFNIMGGKEQNSPIYISRIIPGGIADRHGGLKRGDQLLSVNGVSVEGEHHEKAVELLKAAQGKVKLVVRYTPKVLEEMESRFEKMRSAKRRQQT